MRVVFMRMHRSAYNVTAPSQQASVDRTLLSSYQVYNLVIQQVGYVGIAAVADYPRYNSYV